MISWIKPSIPRTMLVIALLVGVTGYLLLETSKSSVHHATFEQQTAAAELMLKSLDAVKQYRLDLGLPINRETDPNGTGLIGETFTEITTSIGNIEAKQTSTNPSFAALMVRLFHEANLQPNDVVAIGASGSFPSLIIATLAAAKVMELKPLIIYSVGSSMYGANIPEFTFLEMRKPLAEQNILPYPLHAVSIGGDNDRGDGMFFASSQGIMKEIAQSSEAIFIYEENNAASINKRLTLYQELNNGLHPDCFVNIGGATPNYGNTGASLKLPNGLITRSPIQSDHLERGLIFEYLERGTPVIHLLNIRDLALRSGIAINPVPFLEVGSEQVYFDIQYNRGLSWIFIVIICGMLIMAKRRKQ